MVENDYRSSRSGALAKDDQIESEIQEARKFPQQEKGLQRIYDAHKAVDSQIKITKTVEDSLDNTRNNERALAKEMSKTQSQQLDLTNKVTTLLRECTQINTRAYKKYALRHDVTGVGVGV